MHVLVILSVLGALAIADAAPHEPLADPGWRVLAALLAMLLPVLAGTALAWTTASRLRNGTRSRWLVMWWHNRLRLAHTALWLLVAGGTVYGLGWTQLIRFNAGLDRFILLDDLLVVLPVLAPLILSWGAFYDVERALRDTAAPCRLVQQGSTDSPSIPTRWEFVGFQLRTVMGIALTPLLLLLVAQDTARLLWPSLTEGPHAWLVLMPPLIALVVGFPVLLRYVWKTEPLPDGPLRSRLEAVAARCQLRIREILVWKTNRQLLNAAVAGFLPRWRYVFLTDSLLENMNDAEIEAVFGHEVGHIRHRHVLLRALVLLVPISLWSLGRILVPEVDQWESVIASVGWKATAISGAVAVAALGAYIATAFGFCSRRFERQADLFGCHVSSWGQAQQDVDGASTEQMGLTATGIQTFIQALEKLATLNGVSRRTPSWQHSSIALRVAFLQSVSCDDRQATHCHRQVRRLSGLLLAIVAAGFLVPLCHSLVLAAF